MRSGRNLPWHSIGVPSSPANVNRAIDLPADANNGLAILARCLPTMSTRTASPPLQRRRKYHVPFTGKGGTLFPGYKQQQSDQHKPQTKAANKERGKGERTGARMYQINVHMLDPEALMPMTLQVSEHHDVHGRTVCAAESRHTWPMRKCELILMHSGL